MRNRKKQEETGITGKTVGKSKKREETGRNRRKKTLRKSKKQEETGINRQKSKKK